MGRSGESLKRAAALAAVLAALTIGASCRNQLADVVSEDVEAWQAEQQPPRVITFTSSAVGVNWYDHEIPISISATADVTHWMVNESATRPLPSDPGWLSAAPTTCTVSAGFGTKTIYAWVKNARDSVNTEIAMIEVTVKVYGAPEVDSFTLGASTIYTPSVTFSLASATPGAGSTAVTHWMVNESSVEPNAADPNWQDYVPASPPTNVTYNLVDTTLGMHTLYAWVKNDQDKVSLPASRQVTYASYGAPVISGFDVTTTITYDRFISYTITATVPGAGAAVITAWQVTETSTPPAAGGGGWTTGFASPQSSTYQIAAGAYRTQTIYAWVKNDHDLVSSPATDTVQYAPYGAPSIDTFTLTSATPTDNPAISFNLSTTSYGAGSTSITGWQVNESSTPPDPAGGGWLGSAPSGFTVAATTGAHTVYAWVKNEHSLVNAAKTISVTINVPGGTWSSPYVNGREVAAHEVLTLTSTVDLQSSGITVSGIGTGLATLGGDNRTITVAPGAAGNGLWNAGAGTLTVNATTIYGIAFSKSITLTVFNGFCVSPTGSDLAAGTTVAPFAKIPYAITQAVTKYKGAGRTAEVRVSLGSFTTNWGSATDRIIMVDGVSLLGGFPASYQTAGRAIDVRTKSTLTSITDESTTGGATLTNPNRAVSFDTAGTEDIGRATVLEGFFIKAGGGVYSAGVELNDATTGDSTTAAPTIRGNRIYAGTTATEGSIAIDALYHTAPLIQGNYLNDEHQTGDATGSTTMTYSYGVVMYQVQPVNSRVPTISGNTVWGALSGTGSSSCESTGIHVFGAAGGTIVIEANDVRAGPAYNSYSMIVQDGGTAEILNNRIVTHDPTSTSGVSRAIWKKGTMAMNVRNNTIIYGGDGFVAKTAQAIYIGSATGAVTIQNNIFRCAWMSQTAVHCIYEASAVTPTVQNNDWYDEAPHPSTVYYLYHDSGGSNYDDVATFQASGAATASGNLNVDPVLTTGQPNWWMNYRLQATSPASVKTGGLDGSGWGFATDKDGTARTVPWSMGCDEVN